MRIIFFIGFSLSSFTNFAANEIEASFAHENQLPPIFGSGIIGLFMSAITAMFIFNSLRILLNPESGNKLNGMVRVIIGLVIIVAISKFL